MCEVKEYINFQTGEKLDLERVSKLKDNAMLKVKPQVWIEWDFKENEKLGFNIWKLTFGSKKKVWWVCLKCKSEYDAVIGNKIAKNSGCPYCYGFKVNHTNSLASLNPKLASEWHPTLNGELTPHDVTCGNGSNYWWICEKGHHWKATPKDRGNGNGCPYCSGRYAWKGETDMWTTNPKLARLLANPEDGYKYSEGSGQNLNWRCPDCDDIINNKKPYAIKKFGLGCPQCSDGLSFGERAMYQILNKLSLKFTHDKVLDWSENKRYDFYVPDYDMIIEVHGSQHYNSSFEHIGGRSLKEEKENDRYKRELAYSNGIKYYIEIDSSKSEIYSLKKSILNSEMASILNIKESLFDTLDFKFSNVYIRRIWELHNNSLGIPEIRKELSISSSAIRRYLRIGTSLGKCNYDPKKALDKHKRKVVKLNLFGNFIAEYESITDATKENGIKSSNSIKIVCYGKSKTAYGYKWMYKEDYEKYIEEQNKSDLQCSISSF